MFPYTRLLRCFFVAYNSDYEKIAAKLRSWGYSWDVEVLQQYRERVFLPHLPENQRMHFHGSGMHSLHPSIHAQVITSCRIGDFFSEETGMLDLNRFDNLRRNRLLQRHIECSFIGKMQTYEIHDDLLDTYNIEVDEEVMDLYRSLVIDLSWVRDQKDWFAYMKTLPRDEQVFRNSIILQDKQYVRWKLGVHVEIDPLKSVKSMATDLFFRYKESLADPTLQGLVTTDRLANLTLKTLDRVNRIAKDTKNTRKAKDFNALLLTFNEVDDEDEDLTIEDITAQERAEINASESQ